MNRSNELMLRGPLLKNIISYTIPIILTSLLQLLFNAADLIVVGQFCGSVSVAAVGATGAVTSLVVNLFIGLSVGAGVSVAHGIGSREDRVVRRTVHTAVPMALVSGLVVTVLGIACTEPFLRGMGTPENVLPLSAVYMQIYFAGAVFIMLYNFCAAILRAAGDTRSPLLYLTIAGLVNVVLNVVFVLALDMNVAGVALATTISQAISAVLVTIALMRRDDACRLVLSQMRFYREPLLKMLRIGLPTGIQSSLFSISNVLIQSSVNSFGDVFMSGNAAASNLEGFVYVGLNAFHQTTVNFAGQNAGARQFDRVRRIGLVCMACVTVMGLVTGAAAVALSPELLSIYITDSMDAIAYGVERLVYICLPYFICGLMEVSTGLLLGMGASFSPMVISVVGICVFRVGWLYTIFQLPQFHTPQMLYLSYPISWALTFLIQQAAFARVYRSNTRQAAPVEA